MASGIRQDSVLCENSSFSFQRLQPFNQHSRLQMYVVTKAYQNAVL